MLVEQFGFVLCCFSQFLVNADTKVEGLVGHELLGLNLILVAECQRVLAFVLVDELADDCQLSVLVFLVKNVEFANFKRWFRWLLNLQGFQVQLATESLFNESYIFCRIIALDPIGCSESPMTCVYKFFLLEVYYLQ